MQSLVPRLVAVVQALVPMDENQAAQAMEIFDELVESEVSVIVPHIRLVMDLCLQVRVIQDLCNTMTRYSGNVLFIK